MKLFKLIAGAMVLCLAPGLARPAGSQTPPPAAATAAVPPSSATGATTQEGPGASPLRVMVGKSLDELKGRVIRLEFQLKDADLYTFRAADGPCRSCQRYRIRGSPETRVLATVRVSSVDPSSTMTHSQSANVWLVRLPTHSPRNRP